MNRDELLELYTTDDVSELLMELGSNPPLYDNGGNLIFNAICHGSNSLKLYYYPSSKTFFCYSHCHSMSLFDLVANVYGIEFKEAFKILANRKGVRLGEKKVGLFRERLQIDDLSFLERHLFKIKRVEVDLPQYDDRVMNLFSLEYPLDWYEEGISPQIAEYFDIRYYHSQNKAVIPHRDINGNLVGIRGRSYNEIDLMNGRKYMPMTIQNVTYRYAIHFNLYGLYENQNNIKRVRKAIIFESEKAVMQYASLYGQDNNIALALCGMNMSNYQRDLLTSLGIEEVVFCLDKQYTLECLDERKGKEWNGYVQYVKKLSKFTKMFINYCNVSLVLCYDERLDYKDSPIDKGQRIFEELISERYYVDDVEELNQLLD